jgi:hypothetical protein
MKFLILSGTGVLEFRETAHSAREALERVRHLMKLRRPGVRIENELGRDITFFQLKDAAASEQSAGDLSASRAFDPARRVRPR